MAMCKESLKVHFSEVEFSSLLEGLEKGMSAYAHAYTWI